MWEEFFDDAPEWPMVIIFGFLIMNPCLLYAVGFFITGGVLFWNSFLPWLLKVILYHPGAAGS